MRLEAKVQEGDRITSVLVPLSTVMAFRKTHGRSLNEAIVGGDFDEWEPWVCWHATEGRTGEGRTFDAWCQEVDWCGIYNAPNALDPSGGEARPSTSPESPGSQPEPLADGTPS